MLPLHSSIKLFISISLLYSYYILNVLLLQSYYIRITLLLSSYYILIISSLNLYSYYTLIMLLLLYSYYILNILLSYSYYTLIIFLLYSGMGHVEAQCPQEANLYGGALAGWGYPYGCYAEMQVPEGPHELSNLRPSPRASCNFGSHDLRSEGQFWRMPWAKASHLRAYEVLERPAFQHKLKHCG